MAHHDDDELTERARARIGQTLSGKYRIEAVIGVGGMASVYAAQHRNGRRVALKLLHPELSLRAELRKRFLREGHAANAVKHPGAVDVIDDDVAEDGAAFLVMELLEGESLETLWSSHGGRLNPRSVLAIGRELCDVLAAAHKAGVVHRDIKPANVFITWDGQLKVLDFGIARLLDGTSGKLTETGSVVGTPAFMAPEQASGRASRVDELTDVWAVGATLFSLLTGQPVHVGETSQHMVLLAATEPARSIATVLPDLPEPIVRIVDRALAFEKSARWPSAESMRSEIVAASTHLFGDPMPSIIGAELVVRRQIGGRMEEALAATVPSEPAPRGGGSGNTTASLVATVSHPARAASAPAALDGSGSRRSERARFFTALAAGAGIAVVLAILFVGGRRLVERRPDVAHAEAPPASVPVPPSVAAEAAAPLVASSLTPAPVPSPVATPSASPVVPPARTVTRPLPPPPARPPAACDPPYYYDKKTGNKIFKRECI